LRPRSHEGAEFERSPTAPTSRAHRKIEGTDLVMQATRSISAGRKASAIRLRAGQQPSMGRTSSRSGSTGRWRSTLTRSRRPLATIRGRFEELIGGRPYLIEVAAVEEDRWRACIVRLPGVPTALMPFYGSTPVEAARLLSQWLTRAHERAANGAMPARRYIGVEHLDGDSPPRLTTRRGGSNEP
jgi:hypothetical protein